MPNRSKVLTVADFRASPLELAAAKRHTGDTWWHPRFDDRLIIAAFDSDGMIIWKQFFRRTRA
jgi:hypothetical protein